MPLKIILVNFKSTLLGNIFSTEKNNQILKKIIKSPFIGQDAQFFHGRVWG